MRKKPRGFTGPIEFGPGEPGFRPIEFPTEKAELELYILERTLVSARKEGWQPYPLQGEPQQNPEDHFDFTLPTSAGVEHLDLMEVIPGDWVNGPHSRAPGSYVTGEFADAIISEIRRKSQKYGAAAHGGIHLLLYHTDWKLRIGPTVAKILMWELQSGEHGFATIYFYAVDDEDSGEVIALYPPQAGLLKGFDVQEARRSQIALPIHEVSDSDVSETVDPDSSSDENEEGPARAQGRVRKVGKWGYAIALVVGFLLGRLTEFITLLDFMDRPKVVCGYTIGSTELNFDHFEGDTAALTDSIVKLMRATMSRFEDTQQFDREAEIALDDLTSNLRTTYFVTWTNVGTKAALDVTVTVRADSVDLSYGPIVTPKPLTEVAFPETEPSIIQARQDSLFRDEPVTAMFYAFHRKTDPVRDSRDPIVILPFRQLEPAPADVRVDLTHDGRRTECESSGRLEAGIR